MLPLTMMRRVDSSDADVSDGGVVPLQGGMPDGNNDGGRLLGSVGTLDAGGVLSAMRMERLGGKFF